MKYAGRSGATGRGAVMNVGDPQHDDQNDEKHADEEKEKEHVALALAGEIPLTRGSGIGGAGLPGVVLHPPNGRLGGLGLGAGCIARSVQFLGEAPALLDEKTLLLFQLPATSLQRIRRIIA